MSENTFHCSMCHFMCTNYVLYYRHTVRLHKHDPNFIVQCSIGSCAYSTKSWNAFKPHVRRKHKECQYDNVNSLTLDHDHSFTDDDTSDSEILDDDYFLDTSLRKAFSNATFLMQLESNFNLSKVAINSVVSSVSDLIQSHQDLYKKQIISALNESGLNGTDLIGNLNIDDKFDLFKTEHMRQKFYSSYCSLVPPVEVMLGVTPRLRGGLIKHVKSFGYIIPLFDSLQSLFSMPEIKQYMNDKHCTSQNEYMFDLCDGEEFQKNPIFFENLNAIQIILNTDDIEVVNPLGSHVKKHKLTMFYYSLGNIPPQFRSKLSCIQLLAVAKTVDLKKYGIDELLCDFVDSVKHLATEGRSFCFGNVEKTVKGTVIIAPCDTPAAGWLGGFKEGVGFAYRCCRTCDISPENVKAQFYEDPAKLRSAQNHKERCEILTSISSQSRSYWSKMWGINRTSVLCKIPGLDLSSVLVHDPMHVLLEGIVQHELRLFLFDCVKSRKLFTLKWLNTRLTCFGYSKIDKKNKPQVIDNASLKPGGKIKQTAIEMYTLICLLPFIIGQKICRGEERWVHLLQLLQITLLSLSSFVSKQTACEMQNLIFSYLSNFKKCYPKGSFLPKMHYLIHFPRQLLNYGPLRNQWCMRFEGKHGFFKKMKWTNFKNLPLSVAQKHQQWLCYKQIGHNGRRNENFLYDGDKVRNGEEIIISERFPFFQNTFSQDKGFLVKELNILGHEYSSGSILLLAIEKLPPTPVLGVIENILIVDHVKYFVYRLLKIEDFDEHFNAYIVEASNEIEVLQYSELTFKWPEHMYVVSGRKYVMLRHFPFVEPLTSDIVQ